MRFEVHFSTISLQDLMLGYNLQGGTMYPTVPGFEAVGVVKETGALVTKFKPGDKIGVTQLQRACLECAMCKAGDESLCLKIPQNYLGWT